MCKNDRNCKICSLSRICRSTSLSLSLPWAQKGFILLAVIGGSRAKQPQGKTRFRIKIVRDFERRCQWAKDCDPSPRTVGAYEESSKINILRFWYVETWSSVLGASVMNSFPENVSWKRKREVHLIVPWYTRTRRMKGSFTNILKKVIKERMLM